MSPIKAVNSVPAAVGKPPQSNHPEPEAEPDFWSAEKYSSHFGSKPTSPERPLELVRPYLDKASTRLLDFGCGDGVVSLELADKVKSFTGIDGSTDMINAARKRGLTDLRVLDGHFLQRHIYESNEAGVYDVVFSNLALHWMSRNPEIVVWGVHKALKPGGVFVAQFVGHMTGSETMLALSRAMEKRGYEKGKNWTTLYLPSSDEYKLLLERCGFTVDVMENRVELMALPHGVDAWFETFVESHLPMLSAKEKREVLEEVREDLRPVCYRNGKWSVTANFIIFRAFKHLVATPP
ncbi:S-adenosyl-L-methionine-dependent methyltransferase [Ramicandelaber brevisporus]|nr:S-adenosyl-L-methionine-dependent methyltransferase [Ramicandelaber brevisporus]